MLVADLHAALAAALDTYEAATQRAQTEHPDWWPVAAPRFLRRVAADRRVLARHGVRLAVGTTVEVCTYCDLTRWPCPDVEDLAARYDVNVPA